MNNKKKQAKTILDKYLSGQADAHEKALIESWYNEIPDNEMAPTQESIEIRSRQAWKQIQLEAEIKPNYIRKYYVAASLIVCLFIAGYTLINQQKKQSLIVQTGLTSIQPTVSEANLTMTNGTRLNLASIAPGTSIQEALDNPKLRYSYTKDPFQFIDNPHEKALIWQQTEMNRIETSAGGFYQVVLEDGSRIWLNSCSKLHFPSSFKGKSTREIFLSGEAYFEVEHNMLQPFVVKTKQQELQVLGTRFNLQAFDNEDITKTTLLEGAVKLRFKDKVQELILKPGQQSILAPNKHAIASLNTRQEIAWTNGYFSFNDESLHSIIRQLQRWYNIKVDYSNIPNTRYNGTIAKNVSLAKVINLLELTGNVKFKLEKDSLRAFIK